MNKIISRGGDKWVNGKKRKEKEKKIPQSYSIKTCFLQWLYRETQYTPYIRGICWLPVATADLISTLDLELQI